MTVPTNGRDEVRGHNVKVVNISRVNDDDLLNPSIGVVVDGKVFHGASSVDVSIGLNHFPYISIEFLTEQEEAEFRSYTRKSATDDLGLIAENVTVESNVTDVDTSTEGVSKTKVIVRNCARCGMTHEVVFWKFKDNPIALPDGNVMTHWGRCHYTDEPILLRVDKE